MLEIYLPIVQVNIDIFLLLFLSLFVGVLSGLFGVGGGFLMTPFLIFMGIPPVYAVPNEVNNILGGFRKLKCQISIGRVHLMLPKLVKCL